MEIETNLNLDDYVSLCRKAGAKGKSFKTRHKNIQSLATKLFKVFKGIANLIVSDNFPP